MDSTEDTLLGDVLMKFIRSLTEYGEAGAMGLVERVLRNSARLDAVEEGLGTRVLIALVQILAWDSNEWQKVGDFYKENLTFRELIPV